MVVADAGSEVIYTFSKEDGRISSGADAALVREGTHTHTHKKKGIMSGEKERLRRGIMVGLFSFRRNVRVGLR